MRALIVKILKEEYINLLNENNLSDLDVGESLQFNDVTDLIPFKLKPLVALGVKPNDETRGFSNKVISDLPELSDMIFNYDQKQKKLTRIK